MIPMVWRRHKRAPKKQNCPKRWMIFFIEGDEPERYWLESETSR